MSEISSQSTNLSATPASTGFAFPFQSSGRCCHCDALLPDSDHSPEENPFCPACRLHRYDVKAFCLVLIDGGLASPWFANEGLLEQFADFFHVPRECRYAIQESTWFFGPARLDERSAFIQGLDQSRILLDKLLALPDKHPSELPYIAAAAGLLGYALPQFEEGYGEEVE